MKYNILNYNILSVVYEHRMNNARRQLEWIWVGLGWAQMHLDAEALQNISAPSDQTACAKIVFFYIYLIEKSGCGGLPPEMFFKVILRVPYKTLIHVGYFDYINLSV